MTRCRSQSTSKLSNLTVRKKEQNSNSDVDFLQHGWGGNTNIYGYFLVSCVGYTILFQKDWRKALFYSERGNKELQLGQHKLALCAYEMSLIFLMDGHPGRRVIHL